MTTSSDLYRRAFSGQRAPDRRTSDTVFRVARSRIVGGDWPAGMRLDLEAIARDLDVSQTPVREAVLRLEADGFVTKLPYRGTVVRGVESSFIEEVFALRLRLEGLGARLAAHRRSDAHLAQMHSVLDRATKEASKHDWDWQADANDRFHVLVAESGGAAETARLISPLLRHTERFMLMLHLNIQMREVEPSHNAVVEAIEAGDGSEAERAIRTHLIDLFGEISRDRMSLNQLQFLPAVLSKSELLSLRAVWGSRRS